MPPLRRSLVAVLALACLAAFARAQDRLDLTVLHTNDLHGHLLPFAYTEPERSKTERPSVGGAARRATLIRDLKRRIKNPVFVIDSGDVATRGPLTNDYEGLADIEALNATGCELACIGNNEFKLKDGVERDDAAGAQEALKAMIARSRFPWLCANAGTPTAPLLPGVQPFVVRDFGGVRVGFLGLTAPRSAGYPQTKGWVVSDPIAAAKTWIPVARRQCDVLIAVTHLGVDLDKELAAATTGIDAIVGGDSHTFLYRAVEVENADHSARVPIVQSGEFGVNLGRFDLYFERRAAGWRLARYEYALLPVGPQLREAPDVAALVARFVGPLQTPLFTLPAARIGTTPEARDRLTTQVLVDALRQQTGAELAMNPVGAGFFESFRRSPVTRYDLWAALPFKNHAVTIALTGAQLAALIAKTPTTVVSGADIRTLDPTRSYRVALVDFVASDTYGLDSGRLVDTGRDIRRLIQATFGPGAR
jgi:2',3'-cyclic-nucleotide 2'-phosphodiesterase (5'-nucleotidase family)